MTPIDVSARSQVPRRAMVDKLEMARAIRTAAVSAAFDAVPRELFVPEIAVRDGLDAVYEPASALVTARDERGTPISSSSAPSIMAPMLEQLELREGLCVLEVGAGTGYNAALLKHLVGGAGRVISVEIDQGFARRARRALTKAGYHCRVVTGDGHEGWPTGSPFDRVIATASCDHVPSSWRDQLIDGGLVELPLRLGDAHMPQLVVCFRRDGECLHSTAAVLGGFMAMRQASYSPVTKPTARLTAPGSGIRSSMRCSLEGDGISRLSAPEAKRALALLRNPARHVRTISQPGIDGLNLFLALSGGPRLVRCTLDTRFGMAVVFGDGRSLATVTRTIGDTKPGRFDAWGDDRAESALAQHIQRWERAGRPTLEDLRLTVSYSGRSGSHWRTIKRPGSTITMDWKPPAR